ncbi:hypothetical protein [Haloplanus halophilus]|uniref:hypothetical protein n=1 Tax=Haloplanus halophilus TaxID=2949993 RepID=UPI00203BC83B|nr:hypothetical protein [Haloplanus sp. GDY1]
MSDSDRPTAILTDRQRTFLRGEGDLGERGERAARARIRDRLDAAFDDLRLILNTDVEAFEDDVEQVLTDIDAGRMWALPALLFLWAVEHPTFSDRDDMVGVLSSPGEDWPIEDRIEWITESFDSQVERGVTAALEDLEFDQVPEEVDNELTVGLGRSVSEMTPAELAELSRETIDFLFRRDDLDNELYAEVMALKLGRDTDSDDDK